MTTTGDELDLVTQVATQIFEKSSSLARVDQAIALAGDRALWDELEASGMTLVSIDEACGGSGGGLGLAAAIVRAAGGYSAVVPLAETTLVGAFLLAQAGTHVPKGGLATCWPDERLATTLVGSVSGVGWASFASHLLVVDTAGGRVMLLPAGEGWTVDGGRNIAGEPRQSVSLSGPTSAQEIITVAPDTFAQARLRATLGRALLISGAVVTVLELTCRHLNEREQFGRPLARQQALQQRVAELTGAVISTRAATDAAVAQLAAAPTSDAGARYAVATAKVRANQAAVLATRIGHQLHGAIGATAEHPLHLSTLRLRAWVEEDGNDFDMKTTIGASVLDPAGPGPWEWLTGKGAR